MIRSIAVRTLLAVLLTAAAGLGYATSLEVEHFLLPMLAASTGAAVLSGSANRLPALLALTLSVGVLAGLTPVLVSITTEGATSSTFIDALTDGWRMIATTAAPAPRLAPITGFVVISTWFTAMITSELLHRGTNGAGALAPPLVFAAGTLALAENGDAGRGWWIAAVVIVMAGVLVVDHRLRDSDEASPGAISSGSGVAALASSPTAAPVGSRAIGGIAIGLAVTTIAALLAPQLLADDHHSFTARDHVTPPTVRIDTNDPLAVTESLRLYHHDSALFDLEIDQALDRTLYLRTAVLTDHDGLNWSSGEELVTSGTKLPDAPYRVAAQTPIRQQVTFTDDYFLLTGSTLLPLAGWPTRVEGAGPELALARHSGALALRASTDPTTPVEADVLVSTPSLEALRLADIALPPIEPERSPLPEDLQRRADEATGSGTSVYTQLASLETYFEEAGFKTLFERGNLTGHSYAVLEAMLGRRSEATGTPEQFASLFALFATASKQYPTRVATGFAITPPPPGEPTTVTGAQAHAWPEVFLDDLGWVAFEPSPVDKTATPTEESGTEDEPEPVTSLDQGPDGGEDQQRKPQTFDDLRQETSNSGPPRLLLVMAAVLLALLCYVAALAWTKRRTRAHAVSQPPNEQVVLAWRDVVGLLSRSGVDGATSQTGSEIVRSAGDLVPELQEPVRNLAAQLSDVLHAGRLVPPGDAAAAWRSRDEIARRLSRLRSPVRRITSWLSPEPLLPARVPRPSVGTFAGRLRHQG